MESSRVTMNDIAKRLGVHQSTVSLALSNHPRISDRTKKLIQDTAEEMGYVPDPELVSLISYRKNSRVKRSDASIVLISDMDDPYLFDAAEYIRTAYHAMQVYGRKLGFSCSLLRYRKDFRDSESLNRILRARNIKGVVLGYIYNPETHFELCWDRLTAVKINEYPSCLKVDMIVGNYLHDSRLALENVLKMGYSRPLYVNSEPIERQTDYMYYDGFMHGMRMIQPENRLDPFLFKEIKTEDINRVVFEHAEKVRPDVIISGYNNLIIPCFELTRKGFHCAFVSLEVDEHTRPTGGIEVDHKLMATTAVDKLLSSINAHRFGLQENPTITMVNSRWVTPTRKWPPESVDARKVVAS